MMTNNLEVWQRGEVKPCCIYQGTWGNINNYDEILETQNALADNLTTEHQGCNTCWSHERMGIESKRIQNNKWLDLHRQGEIKVVPNILEIKLSNLCNLACTTCGAESSSIWANKLNIKAELNQFTKKGADERLANMLDLIERRGVNTLNLLGGEPTMNPEARALLDKLIDLGWNDRIAIQLVTNGVDIEDFMLKYADKFDFNVNLSLDGKDEVYEYMRWGGQWANILKTVELLGSLQRTISREMTINITYTYSIVNIFHYTEFKRWTEEELPKYLELQGLHLNRVDWPIELEARTMREEMREQLHPDIRDKVIQHVSDKTRRKTPLKDELLINRDAPRGISFRDYKLDPQDLKNMTLVINDERKHYGRLISEQTFRNNG
jgi:sulfatase maturation enzyme AslB (radical SAM superfamily)